jgi:hypothetical protein
MFRAVSKADASRFVMNGIGNGDASPHAMESSRKVNFLSAR